MTRRSTGRDGGFTLVELLVSMVLLGILGSIALAQFLVQRERAMDADARSLARNAALALEAGYSDDGHYTRDVGRWAGRLLRPEDQVAVVLYRDVDRAPATSADEADATGGFCLAVASRSGRTVVYDSLGGGLQPPAVEHCA